MLLLDDDDDDDDATPTEQHSDDDVVKDDQPEHKRAKPDSDSDDESSSTSACDLDACHKCGRMGEVLQCDFTGCELLWHAKCLPAGFVSPQQEADNGPSSSRWFCPARHVDMCFACVEPGGMVLICDEPHCKRVFHPGCVPELKNGRLPKKDAHWECPQCIKEKSAHGLTCKVCGLAYLPYDKLVKCPTCGDREAVHLGCFATYLAGVVPEHQEQHQWSCWSCAAAIPRSSSAQLVVDVELSLASHVTAVERAQLHQVLTQQAPFMSRAAALALLDRCLGQ